MPITLKDIADRTGVSPSVVSTVLSGRDNGTFVSKDTRERVQRVAQELNYTPVRSGRPRGSRRLRRQRVDEFIGVWVPELDAAGAEMLSALQNAMRQYADTHSPHEAGEHDFGLRLLQEDDLPRLDMLGVMGLIVLGDIPLPRTAAAANTPTVVIGEIDQVPHEVVTVHMDNFAAGRALGDYLWRLGHRHVAFVAPNAKKLVTMHRWQGLQSVWVDHGASRDGCVPAPYDVVKSAGTQGSLTPSTLPLRDQIGTTIPSLFTSSGAAPTALVTFNETVAVYTLQALSSIGKSVPDDVSVVTFGDTSNGAEAQTPPLTTIRPPLAQIAATTIAQLYDLSLSHEDSQEPMIEAARRDLSFPGELVSRKSARSAPAEAAR